MRIRVLVGFVLGLMAVVLASGALASPPPWERTETRADCASYDALRSPFFGETHVHTKYSSDAVIAGNIDDPRGAYRFAKGDPIGLPPYDPNGNPTRIAQLRRPLDFTVVTDHAEQFGEIALCLLPGSVGYDDQICIDVRAQLVAPLNPLPPLLPPLAFINLLFPYTNAVPAQPFDWCGPDREDCLPTASLIWLDIQDAAEEFYDRSAACEFTSFVGYEWTATPGGDNLHRNIVFRNAVTQTLPTSYVEEGTVQGLWDRLKTECLDGLPGCDVMTIPHNSNLSRGRMFETNDANGNPFSMEDAAFRSEIEPLIEIINHKGESECQPGAGTNDELCGFEKAYRQRIFSFTITPGAVFNPLSFIRNGLKEGLLQDEALGANPFRLGFVGGTDSHNSTPGLTNEEDYASTGHIGLRDRAPGFILTPHPPGGIASNPSGLAVVWAEENSRDALFVGMRRRETYTTSGTRPIVRVFAGDFSKNLCDDPDFVREGYLRGAPMGAVMGPVRRGRSPRFAVLAQKDPGGIGIPSTPLQRIQVIKGWVDAAGQAQEQVFEIAGDPGNGASVDTSTCVSSGAGFDTLCAVWEDPDFDRDQRAFYYARVLENPTCRWSQYVCNSVGVDCADPNTILPEHAQCCNPSFPPIVQERAWSSPNWYRPEGIGRLKGTVRYGTSLDTLRLKATIGQVPASFDLNTQDLEIRISDDDEIYTAIIPAGTMQVSASGRRFSLNDPTGSVDGIRQVSVVISKKGQAVVKLRTIPMVLGNADASDHFVETKIVAGTFQASHSRLWEVSGKKLRTR